MTEDMGQNAGATHIEVDAGVRYWEDASVNGVDETDENPTIFGADNDRWRVKINLAEGRIEGWPKDMTANVHYKVCDDGEYWLLDKNGERIAKYRDYYVPGDFLCHGDNGYGDYIILKIDGAGKIADYQQPGIDPAEWERVSA
ncbi:MAG: hypothetical protein J7498_05600 [Sphingobium sp.]|nr:hypothetical protein [Sphingobium sp.]